MINSEVSDASYVIQGGVTSYPIGFEYHFNEQNSPQLLVKIGDREAIINVDFQLSSDNSEIILIPTEEEAKNQTSPNDTRWMERINGQELYITRNIPFKQTSDYTVGRISPEQIEYDFDRTVMRDQEILRVVKEFGVDVALAESLSNAAVETANEAVTAANTAIDSANNAVAIASETVSVASEAKEVAEQASRDAIDAMAESSSAVKIAEDAKADTQAAVSEAQAAAAAAQQAADSVANKQDKLVAGEGIKIEGNVISTTDAYSKTEIDNKITVIDTAIDANTEAIQKTREDYIEADSEIHQILNSHAGELSTLRGNQASLGNQVAGIEAKIPGTASGTNYLVTKQMLLDEEMDIREDLNESVGELQTQITAQAAEIAKKQDELTAGENITIVDGVISATGGGDATFPDQTGNAGKFLQTDGSNVSWAKTIPYSETRDSIVAGFTDTKTMNSTIVFGKDIEIPTGTLSNVYVGHDIYGGLQHNTVFGSASLGINTNNTIVLGQLTGKLVLESDSFFVANQENLYKVLDTTTGLLPAERLSATGGATGQVLTKTADGMEWQDAQGGGSAEYPDQTDNAGKFLQTDGANVKWADALINNSTDLGVLSVGYGATATGAAAIAFGANTQATGESSVAVGPNANATETRTTSIGALAQATQLLSNALGAQSKALAYNATQIGSGTNETNGSLQFRSYQLVSDDGTIPTDRYTTTPTGAGTYVPKLTIAEDGTATREWGAESTGGGGGASGDYLPLSGGTLTGQVSIDIGKTSGYTWTDYPVLLFNWTNPDAFADYTGTGFFATANGVSFGKKGASTPLVTLDPSNKIIYPGVQYIEAFGSGINIGNSFNRFRSIAVAKIATGQNPETFEDTFIEVPKGKSGTIAVVEDLDGADYVIESQLPTADNGYTWYRKYKSGWVEQGGVAPYETNTGTVSFAIPMTDSEYQILANVKKASITGNNAVFSFLTNNLTTTGFDYKKTFNYGNNTGLAGEAFYWQVAGYAA